ncbi:hypothetical protein [Aromatoleum diolicum]|uniref:Novel STAND NTPase 1 domain-containing protein n=1 Tax=Aromatoleum diolicum TaxID=75796 RepID=A0ABX1QF53_9RHOO|nr:hypothetical protein [Aromatoleum diolicum]NMG76605.1 hypothetical protein [Aromatoleum diolicum]
MSAALRLNPYPGLRAFEPDETALFFGRERETDELRRRLRTARFLAVIGSSGSGKSSLVRSGLIPSLHAGFMAGAGSSWRIAIARPGEDPIGRLAEALDRPEVLGPVTTHADTRRTLLEVTLRDSSLGLAEAVRQAGLPAGENLLVVIDQFEELFRFRSSWPLQAGDEAAAYVKLLLAAAHNPAAPIYVVLTMRSEFIGDCIAFEGLPEAINAGQYLIPRMSRDALRAAITGPAAVSGVTVAPRLLARLLNEVGTNLDRLPVLQHALMRTWDAWARDHADGEALDLRHYEAIGTMAAALSRHADEAYAELDGARERAIAERLFKTLTETTPDGRGVRRPTAVAQLMEVCGAGLEEIERVVDRLRAPGRAFLQPAAGIRLTPQTVVDISHESLMRLWTRLVGWVRDEARAIDIYRRLARSAAQHAAGEASLWRPPELSLGLRWARETRPSAAWAGVEHSEFDRAMRFLQRSRRVHRLKLGLAVAAVALVVLLAIGWFAAEAERQRRQKVALQAQLDVLVAAKSQAEASRHAQTAQVQALRERNATLKSGVASLQQTRRGLETDVATLREDNRRLESEIVRIELERDALRKRSQELEQEFASLITTESALQARTRALQQVLPLLQTQTATLRAQLDALHARSTALRQRLSETEPCEHVLSATMAAPSRSVGTAQDMLIGAAPPPPKPPLPPDPASPDTLRRQIDELTRELAALVEEKAKLQDEAGWLERENVLLDSQQDALRQEIARLQAEFGALTRRHEALQAAAERAEAERTTFADRVQAGEQRNNAKHAAVEAARVAHAELERGAVAEASAIGSANSMAQGLRADNERLAATLAPHVERLLEASRNPTQPVDLAAMLAVKAWHWAPYDADDPARPAVYNTLWQVLNRLDGEAARRLIDPGAAAAGKLATTRAEVLAQALCERAARPLTEAEWRRFMPAGACFRPEAAQPCTR